LKKEGCDTNHYRISAIFWGSIFIFSFPLPGIKYKMKDQNWQYLFVY